MSFKIHMYVEVFKYNFYYDFAEFTSRYLNRKKSDDGAQMSFKVIQHKFSMCLINYQSPWSEEVKLSDKCPAYIMHIYSHSFHSAQPSRLLCAVRDVQ